MIGMSRTREAPTAARVAAVSTGVFALGLGCAALVSWGTFQRPTPAALVVGLAMVVLHTRPMRGFARTRNTEVLTLDDVLYVPMLAMLVPSEALIVSALAPIVGGLALRRPAVKTIFNAGSMLLACSLGILVSRGLGTNPGIDLDLRDVIGAMVGAIFLTCTTALLVRAMVSYATGNPFV